MSFDRGISAASPPPARVAAIDIGTNSVLLLIAERREGRIEALLERATITRLGENVDRTRELSESARARTLACLRDYQREIAAHAVDRIECVGTSAMRDARGGADFAQEVEQVLGARPRILAGSEEADVTFSGTLSGLGVRGPVTVFDIGGGSTEIIIGQSEPLRSDAMVSLDIGSVRLFERHVKSDPPSAEELARVRSDIRAALNHAPITSASATLIGVAGTVTTLAAIALGLTSYDPVRVHGHRFTLEDVARVARQLEGLTLEQRKNLAGLEPKRADVIVVGAAIVECIVFHTGAKELVVSDRGVRWGLAERALSTEESTP